MILNPLFSGVLTHPTTAYVGIPIKDGALGAQIAWKDATSSATITLELSSYDPQVAPIASAGSAWHWEDSGVTITGPAGAAAGSIVVNADNVRQQRARFKIVTIATTTIDILDGVVRSGT
jgi:hypothetical protein